MPFSMEHGHEILDYISADISHMRCITGLRRMRKRNSNVIFRDPERTQSITILFLEISRKGGDKGQEFGRDASKTCVGTGINKT